LTEFSLPDSFGEMPGVEAIACFSAVLRVLMYSWYS